METLLNIPLDYTFKNKKETRVIVTRRPDGSILSFDNMEIEKHDDDKDAIDLSKVRISVVLGEIDFKKKAKMKHQGTLTIFEPDLAAFELGYERSRLDQLINFVEASKTNYLSLYIAITINRKEIKKKRDKTGMNYWLIERFQVSNIINHELK